MSDYTYTALPLHNDNDTNTTTKAQIWRTTIFSFGLYSLVAFMGFIVGDFANVGWTRDPYEANWSKELAAFKRVPTKFQGSFNFTNRFRGPPSKEIDHEWNRFAANSHIDGTAALISVTMEDIRRANKTSSQDSIETTAEYGRENGGGYMGSLELFHHIHCLNMLRKAVHSEYYTTMRPGPDGLRNATLATHLDHCIEILHQVLSCNGDTGLITYHWVKGNPTPYPDFNTWHHCRHAEAILAWSKQREAPIKVPLAKQLFPVHLELDEAP